MQPDLSPDFSIVMPSYNQAGFIDQAIRSVLAQQGDFSIELIICDGGSTDGTVNIIKDVEKRLANQTWPIACKGIDLKWESKKDDGQYQAINEGLNRARGKILAWLNSDDVYTPWAFSVVNDVMTTFPEFQWLVGMYPLFINKSGQCIGTQRRPGYGATSFRKGANIPGQKWYGRWFIQQDSVFWRRGLWQEVGGLETQYPLAADFALWLRFFEHGDPCTVNSLLSGYRMHPDQKTADQEKYDRDAAQVLQDVYGQSFAYGPLNSLVRRAVRRLAPIPLLGALLRRLGFAERVITVTHSGRHGGWQKGEEWIF